MAGIIKHVVLSETFYFLLWLIFSFYLLSILLMVVFAISGTNRNETSLISIIFLMPFFPLVDYINNKKAGKKSIFLHHINENAVTPLLLLGILLLCYSFDLRMFVYMYLGIGLMLAFFHIIKNRIQMDHESVFFALFFSLLFQTARGPYDAVLSVLNILIRPFKFRLPKWKVKLNEQEHWLAEEVGIDKEVLRLLKTSRINSFDRLTIETAEHFTPVVPHGLSGRIEKGQALSVVSRLFESLHPLGYSIFVSKERGDREWEKICLLKTMDPYEILQLHGTDGINHNIDHEDVIAKLKEWETRYSPFSVLLAGYDTAFLLFRHIPEDAVALAEEVCDFCPDVLWQGPYDGVEDLALKIKSTGSLYLWWD